MTHFVKKKVKVNSQPYKLSYSMMSTSKTTDYYCFLGAFPHGLIVTNSSDAVGWIAIQESKSAFVAPIFNATANPCNISSADIPSSSKK